MSKIFYGSIEMDVIRTEDVNAVPVCEGPDYIGTRWTISAVVTVNPFNFGYTRQPNNAPVNDADAVGTAPQTIHALVDYLSQPRRTLIYRVDDTTILYSPMLKGVDGAGFKAIPLRAGGVVQQYQCDVDGGPYCTMAPEILSVHGEYSLVMRVGFTTLVNESPVWNTSNGVTNTALLSNRWEQEADYDDCAFETRTTRGRAQFRLDLLLDKLVNGGTANADDYRSYFAAFATPPGFQRRKIWVKQNDTGDACDYVVVDQQTAVTLKTPLASKLEVTHTRGMQWGGTEAGTEIMLDNAFLLAGAAASGSPWNLAQAAVASAKAMKSNLPMAMESVTVRIYGQPGSKRPDLEKIALSVALSRFDFIDFVASVNFSMTHDVMGKFCELQASVMRGPIQSFFAGQANNNITFARIGPDFPDDGMKNGFTTSARGVSVAFPNGTNTRGTALENLVAQILSLPYTVPPAPPRTRASGDGQVP